MFKEFIRSGSKSGLKSGSKLLTEEEQGMVSKFMFTAKLYIALGVITSVLVIGCLVALFIKLV